MLRTHIFLIQFYVLILPFLALISLIFKKRFLLLKRLLVIGLIPIVIYFIVIFMSKIQSKPLLGHFKIGEDFVCVCGHESFTLIENDRYYDFCPGHNDKYLCGKIVRKKGKVHFVDKEGKIIYTLRWNGKKHYEIHNGKKKNVEQVNNPWRTWLPWIESDE